MNNFEEASSFDVLCLWGFPSEEIKEWEGKTVVFFTSEFTLGLFVYYDGIHCDLEGFQAICKEQVFRSFAYLIHPSLSDTEKETARNWASKAQMVEWQVQLAASDYQDFGIKVFHNLCTRKNIPFDQNSWSHFKDVCKKMPAFICGAGPSLQKGIPFLRQRENQGLIFAGGAALGVLGELGAPFHIAAGIDPDPKYEKVLMQNEWEAPFFYQSRFSTDLLQTIHGFSFQVGSNPGYPLHEWLEEGKFFDGGWTVSTFCTALALHFGCDPIIFVGMDLAYDSAQEGTGVFFEEAGQGRVSTQKDWVLAAKWLEALASKNKDRSFYTTSEEGLCIEGIKKVGLEEIADHVSFTQIDSRGLVHFLRSFWSPCSRYDDKFLALLSSIDRSLTNISTLLRLFESHYPNDPTEKGEYVLHLLDLQEEIAYQKILEPVWDVWRFPLYRQWEDPYARQINQLLFFTKVLEEYKVHICN